MHELNVLVEIIKTVNSGVGILEKVFRKGSISGIIVNEQGQAMSQVNVILDSQNQSMTALSGRFVFDKVKGVYDLSIEYQDVLISNVEKVYVKAGEDIELKITFPVHMFAQLTSHQLAQDYRSKTTSPAPAFPPPDFIEPRHPLTGQFNPKTFIDSGEKLSNITPIKFQHDVQFEYTQYPLMEEPLCRGLIRFQSLPTAHSNPSKTTQATPDQTAVHLCFVLDVSGSMDTSTKYPYLIQAVRILMQNISEQMWISLIVFSSEAELIASFVNQQTIVNQKTVVNQKTIVNQKTMQGLEEEVVNKIETFPGIFQMTNLAAGLELAVKQLTLHSDSSSLVQRLYVLTDGQINDLAQCMHFQPALQELKVEVMSYGFGTDFALETMRHIMEGCYGAGVKRMADTGMIRETFHHLTQVGSSISANDVSLEFDFQPSVLLGDLFTAKPIRRHYPHDQDNMSEMIIGIMEYYRSYEVCFECRLLEDEEESDKEKTSLHIGDLYVHYYIKNHKMTQSIPISLPVHYGAQLGPQNDYVHDVWSVLEAMRSDDVEIQTEALSARIRIAKQEHRHPQDIAALERALYLLKNQGNLDQLSDADRRATQADDITNMTYIDLPDE